MKQIIGNKLYDTEKSKLIYSYIKNIPVPGYFLWKKAEYNCWRDVDLYVTKKENYFIHVKQENEDKKTSFYFGELNEYIEEISKEDAIEIVQKLDPDRAMELFGEVEEA